MAAHRRAPLTPDAAADRLRAILKRHLAVDNPMARAIANRLNIGASWDGDDRIRQIRAIAIDMGDMQGITTALCRDLRALIHDVNEQLNELWR